MSKSLALKSKNEVVNQEDIQVLKDSMFKGFSESEIKFSLAVANELNLSPLLRQVHFVKRYDSKLKRDTVTPQTGIDGFRLIADRTEKYAGSDEPIFEYDISKKPTKASVTVWKIVNGVRCPFTASARWDEFYPGDTMGFMWKSKPHVMLGKCAESQALRKAFPAELSSIYAEEELHQSDADEKKASHVQAMIEKEVSIPQQKIDTTIVVQKSEPTTVVVKPEIVQEPEFLEDEIEPFDGFDEQKPESASGYYTIDVGTKLKGKKLIEFQTPEQKLDLENFVINTKAWFTKEKIKINSQWQECYENIGQYLNKEL